ncbi:hypothetical protein VTN02DRAFT_4028 [Thermoascus thermophilus]
MLLASLFALGLTSVFYSLGGAAPSQMPITSLVEGFPLPNQGHLPIHDPTVVRVGDSYYAYQGGAVGIPVWKANSMNGPWTQVGTVLDGPSVVAKGDNEKPWAPMTIEKDGTFYCFYAVSEDGSRNSAIGVATSNSPEGGNWTDHGSIIDTGSGPYADLFPYTAANAIDPSVFIDPADGAPYLTFGSYWTDIWQPDAMNVAFLTLEGADNEIRKDHNYPVTYEPEPRPEEGSFMSYRAPWYYLWFSHGQCCHFSISGLPPAGKEYSIRVGRSLNPRGPFVDRDGKKLCEGGGTTVYGSNNEVYAPGGQGIMTGDLNHPDILYYHYLNKTSGLAFDDARLGWNYLLYEDGWPVVVQSEL